MVNNVPPRIHVLAKPTGAICNLACSYCFFLDKELLYPGSPFRMTDEMLETYIRQLIAAHRTPQVTVAWQGGEPTLMGVEFYRKAIKFQEKYRKPGMTRIKDMRFENTMQTNGTLLDDEWCQFFKENDFLIGLSIDGPREVHDAYRMNKGGQGTFDKVMRGLRLLQKHGVDTNILTTVNRINADYPLEVYRFLRDEVGTDWVQFIPVVERVDEQGLTLVQEGSQVSERAVRPEQFGRFLTAIFDEWVRHDVGQVYVQTFEAAVRNWMGLASSGMCVFDATCGAGLALEHNGDLYACDHYVEPDYKLGNINDTDIIDLVASDSQFKFGQDKLDALPQQCLNCQVRFACHGECPKNRFATTEDGQDGLNYLCAGWYKFFTHIDQPMKTITSLLRAGRPAAEVMEVLASEEAALGAQVAQAGRNAPCPCGSGRKVKHCHGRRPSANGHQPSRLRAPLPVHQARPRASVVAVSE
jgi:uncharacterized protein